MKRTKITAMFMTMVLVAGVAAGCGAKSVETNDNSELVMIESTDSENDGTENEAEETENAEGTEINIFDEVKNYEFRFSSGAGAWMTTLTIQPDGSFSGQYHDSDMGDTGEDYPYGTEYMCDFHGKFTEPVVKNSYTWQFEIDSIQFEKEPETEEIIDGVKYIYQDAYGLEDAKEIYLYLPDAPVSELPEGYREWVWYLALSDEEGATLGTYGLYNVEAKEGFCTETVSEIATELNAELAALEEEAQQMNDRLREGDLSQIEMNQLSGELFQLWDNELNSLWSRMKEKFDADAMEQLTEEQREWIQWKEREVKAAGSEVEGGSMQPLLENDKAAELTRDRVYELAYILKDE